MGRVSRGTTPMDIGVMHGFNSKAEKITKSATESYSCKTERNGQEKEKAWKEKAIQRIAYYQTLWSG